MSICPGTDITSADKKKTEKRLLTIKEFSTRYGRSRSRTYELIRSGELPAVKDGRSTLIPVDGAEAWARNLVPISSVVRDAF
jgi:excisionase family DNA binding protein